MSGEDRERVWLRTLVRTRREREWPRLVLWDFVGACALLVLVAALIAFATGG